jgi:hypothetical protein
MGYSTDFSGEFELDKPLTEAQVAYLSKFAETRRMTRDPELTAKRPDPIREAVGLPVGKEGEYFVGEEGYFGQNHGEDVVQDNPPADQPSLWCQWVPTDDGKYIVWDEGEKFYDYVEWLEYIIEHFIKRWGYILNGSVYWNGEDHGDIGTITVNDNEVMVQYGSVDYSGSTFKENAIESLKNLTDYLMEEGEGFLDDLEHQTFKNPDIEYEIVHDEIVDAMLKGEKETLDTINRHIEDPEHIYIEVLKARILLKSEGVEV